jgi:hypothetical protein
VSVSNISYTGINQQSTSISATITVSACASAGSAIISVTSQGFNAQGFVSAGGSSSSDEDPVMIISVVPPAPQIIFNGNYIAGTTQAVLPGQLIQLTGVPPSGSSNPTWSLDLSALNTGFCPSSYVGADGTVALCPSYSTGVELGDPPTKNKNISFYWVNSNDQEVISYSYTSCNGLAGSSSATFNIGGPSQATVTVALNSVNIWPGSGSYPELGLGMTNTPGISFQIPEIIPAPGGQFLWVQLIKSYITQYHTVPPLSPPAITTSLDNVLSLCYSARLSNQTSDQPGIELGSSVSVLPQPFAPAIYLVPRHRRQTRSCPEFSMLIGISFGHLTE